MTFQIKSQKITYVCENHSVWISLVNAKVSNLFNHLSIELQVNAEV